MRLIMSDGSASTEVWTDALAHALAVRTAEFPTLRNRARNHAAALLCAFAWLAITAEPLNLQNFSRDHTPTRTVEEPIKGRGESALAPFQPTEHHLDYDPDSGVSGFPKEERDRFSEIVLRTVSQIWNRLPVDQIQSLVEHIDAGLSLGFGFVAVAWGLRRVVGSVRRSWIGPASGVRSGETSAERRREARLRTRLREGLLYEGRRLVCDCVVIDRSRHGARIRTSRPLRSVQKLRFFDTYEQVLYEARVVWQKDTEVGLELAMRFRVGNRAKARATQS
jgi:hypothetical protein